MPFIGSFSGSKLVRGSGAYHPSVTTIDLPASTPVNGVAATSAVTGDTKTAGISISSVSVNPRQAYDPFGNGTITYSVVNSNVATGTITQVQSSNVYISFSTGAFANLYVGQPFYIGGRGATQGGLAAGATYYIAVINSGSGYINLSSTYANSVLATPVKLTFCSSSAGNASGYTWTPTSDCPTWSAGGALPPGLSMNSSGLITGSYTLNNSVGNGLNYDANAGGVTGQIGTGGNAEANYSFSNLYAVQIQATAATGASSTEIFNVQVTVPYQFRQILTTCYVFGGYRSSIPFANVNKCTISTDTNIDTAQNLTHSQGYNMGPWGWNYAYCMGMSDTYSGASTVTCAWNMRTETSRTTNFTSSWVDSVSSCAVIQQEYYYAWSTAGGTIREFNLSTETYNGTPTNQTGAGSSASGGSHEVRGIFNSANVSWAYATRTGTARTGGSMSGSANSKIMQNKNPTTSQWGNNNAAAGSQVWISTNFPTDTTTTTSKGIPNNGVASSEENHTNGQDWGYSIGWYDGAHEPNTYKWVFGTQTGTYNANSMQYQGQAGNSSGWGANRD